MTTETPVVSIVIPAYNQAAFLGDAIRSVIAQTYRNWELIVVDDGSNDDTHAVAAQFGDQARYIRQENRGLSGARNTGIRAARGEWVGLLDADDIWLPKYLEKMISTVCGRADAGVFYCAAGCINKDGSPLSQIVGTLQNAPTDLYQKLLRSNFIIPSTVTIRRDIFDREGLFDQMLPSGCEDWDLWLRFIRQGYVFVEEPSPLVKYRVHGSSLSANVTRMQLSYLKVVEKNFGLDDGDIQHWDHVKRRAYGGFYLYQVLTNVQRQDIWQIADALRKALLADPTIKDDGSVFYELALGNQLIGKRGTPEQLNLQSNAQNIDRVLAEVFDGTTGAELQRIRRRVYATSWKALGLVAYNTEQFSLCRKFLRTAISYQPGLLFEKFLLKNLIISLLGVEVYHILRSLRKGNNGEGSLNQL